jgi:hypothetical protein
MHLEGDSEKSSPADDSALGDQLCSALQQIAEKIDLRGRATQNAANQVKYPNGYRVTKQIVCTAVFGRQ